MKILKALLLAALVMISLFFCALLLRQTEYHQVIFQRFVTNTANKNTEALFSGTVSANRFWISRDLKFHGTGIKALLNTDQGPVSVELSSFDSQQPVYHYFSARGLEFLFEGAKPTAANGAGFKGTLIIGNQPKPFLHLKARLEGIDFSDVAWVNSDNLAGASGQLKGEVEYRIENQKPFFKSNLAVVEPGGKIQARFFDLFVPYLPKAQVREAVKKIAAGQGLVDYQKASFEISLLTPTELKVLLHIMIPVYNLALNLNMTVRLDDENAFAKIAQIAGMVKVAS